MLEKAAAFEPYSAEEKKSKITLLNSLGYYFYKKAERAENKQTRDELMMRSNDYLNRASDIAYHELITWKTRGFVNMNKGYVQIAEQEFDHVLHSDHCDTLSLLGKAVMAFNRGRFGDSLRFFKNIARQNPFAPIDLRFSIATCYYKLGQVEKARKLFEVLLEMVSTPQ